MQTLFHIFQKLRHDTAAATAVEYGLILALVVLAMIASLTQFATSTTTMWNNVSDAVQSVTN
ncbi:Flp family type IVb pilin [Stakelama marina]|uniref:Flp family type IVb pilin n=1 Tax=Stakelama marina TaxID=2826939 RepID=A0A8T4IDS0_9SPHN|nr:Flp family type IVb pilin [Stakelama marina]MBR0552004.1 Flp family type IVb pilin [Stakelama marina]